MAARRATLRALANGLSLGLLLAIGAPGAARAEAAATEAGGGCVHDAALETAVARALRRRVLEIEPTSGGRIEISFGCPAAPELSRVTALMAHGHGGFVSLVDVDATSGAAGQVLGLRLHPAATPALSGPAPTLVRASARPRDEVVRRALAYANAALASTIQIRPPPARGGAHVASTVTTTHDEALEFRLLGRDGQSSTRRWNGYVDSAHAGGRIPLEIAWEALWGISARALRPAAPEDADRAAFRRLIDGNEARLENDALLELGALLATRPLAGWLTAHLDAPSDRTRTLAVNALVTATGNDLRRDAAGAVRPLAEVAAAYRALAGTSSAPHN